MAKNYLVKLVTVLMLLKMVSSMEFDLTQVHKLLPPEERMRIFRTNDENKVPKYDVIHINWSKQHKRSIDGIVPLSLTVFNKDIDLNLKRLSPLVGPNTPAYYFRTSSTGLNYTVEYPFADYAADIYEDENRLASLTVNMEPNGEKYIETGVIGAHNLTIHRIPSRHLIERKSYMATVKHGYYIAQHMNDLDGVFSDPIMNNWISNSYHPFVPIPDVIYPEILPLLDYSIKDNFMNNNELFTYVLTFWSQVDMLYRNLMDPKYKLSIAGVVIAEDMTAFEFINENFDNNDKLDFQGTLSGVEKWLFDRQDIIPINSYDVAFVQTSKESNETKVGLRVTTTQLGLAEFRGACVVNYADKVINKAGIIYDDGRYSDVLTAAHELAHTLGANHDREECGGDDAGFIMSGLSRSPTSNKYKWSQCSVADFESFLMTSPQCLYNVPDQYKDLEPNPSDDKEVPDDVIPDDAIPDGVIPDGVKPDDVIPDDVIPDDVIPDDVIPDDDDNVIFDIRSIFSADSNWEVIGNPYVVLNSGNHRSRFNSRKNYKTISNRAVYPRIMA